MFMTFGFLFISFDSLCTVCLLLLYPLNFEGAHNQFTPFICDGSSNVKEWKESLYNYRYNVFGNEEGKKEIETSRTFGICHHKIKVVK